MCGIVGFVDYSGRFSRRRIEDLTTEMRDAMTHRGPDDAGLWTSDDGRVCLGHRRLSIIDLRPEGRQPLGTSRGRTVVTFNGEIYNYQSIRDSLVKSGHTFRTRTDTEVLAAAIEEYGAEAAVQKFVGMFAFASWTPSTRRLVLARDPFGKKPLYWLQSGEILAFASELTALEVLGDMVGDICAAAVQEYHLLQYIHAPRSIYTNVQKLEPGSIRTIQFHGGGKTTGRQRRYFQFQPQEPSMAAKHIPGGLDRSAEQLRRHLIQAVQDRLVGDVPIGAFLSGGNDSSVVVAIMAKELGIRPRTFSIGFGNSPQSEHLAAREIARRLGTDHEELILEPSAVEMLPTIAASLDEPNGDTSCLPVYLLSQFARRHVTVALSGDGGDEILGGYGRYTDTVREARSFARRLRWRWRFGKPWDPGAIYVGCRILPMTDDELINLVGPLDAAVDTLLASMRRIVRNPNRPMLHRLRELDATTYMPGAVLAKVDRMSMRFALEVRSPFLDVRLANWAAALPASRLNNGRQSKIVLKRLASRYLPDSIVQRPKQGFGLPDRCWSQSSILSLAHDLLLGHEARLVDFVDRSRLRERLHSQADPNSFHVYQIWEMLVLEQWLRNRPSRRNREIAA